MHVTDEDWLGPIDYVVVEFPEGSISAEGFQILLDLADRDAIQVLDLEFLRKAPDGLLEPVEASALPAVPGLDLTVFDGACTHLLDGEDVATAGALIAPGSIAMILVYEERPLIPALRAWTAHGARVVGEGPILPDDLVAALDDTEPDTPHS